jgi:transcriptional regulator with XRE-family HTH domain
MIRAQACHKGKSVGQRKNHIGSFCRGNCDMITRIREVRRARGMTLDDVARRCEPPTTPQTIGRLETGTRTVSVGWLNRIARALGVEAQDLVDGGETSELKVAAVLGPGGAAAPRRAAIVVPPRIDEEQIAILVGASIGDYRAGDEIWCETLHAGSYAQALNRDVLVPRPAGRFMFGRLINRDEDKLQILPLEAGGRQQVVANPPWIAMAIKLVRSL